MTISDLFFLFMAVAGFWGVFSAMMIVDYVSKKGVKINWILIKWHVIGYIGRYHDLTVKESGKPGFWFYSYIVSMNLAFVLAVLGAVFARLL